MNAVAAQAEAVDVTVHRLDLAPNATLKRRLNLAYNSVIESSFRAIVWLGKGHRQVMVAFAVGQMSQSRVSAFASGHCLWIGGASFDLTMSEAEAVRRTFEPLGLRFDPERG